MAKTHYAIAALLLFSGAVLAQPPSPPTVCETASISAFWDARFISWVDICALGILISFLTISLLYMISQAFGKPGLAAWCKNELYQTLVTAVILGSIFGLINFTCEFITPSLFIDPAALPAPNITLFEYADIYLAWLRDMTYTSYIVTASFNALISGISSVVVNESPGGFGLMLRPLGGFSTLSSTLTFIMGTIFIGGILPTMAQMRLLHVVQVMMFNFILPIGLLSRCFEPTRRFGGSMIALAIGLYLFYPFLLMLNSGAVRDTVMIQGATLDQYSEDLGTELHNGMFADPSSSYNIDYVLSPDATRVAMEETYEPNNYDPDAATPGPGAARASIYTDISLGIFSWGFQVIIAALFLPLFNFILLITFVLNLSRVLGEEIDVTNITRMI